LQSWKFYSETEHEIETWVRLS